jgi:secreted PhoX family phosphatase
MAGGYKQFGPTYNTTPFVRLGIEGDINGLHAVDATAASAVNGELAGKIAAITASGVGLANKGKGAVGLFREDLNDMVNASLKASFYFRGGEYYVAEARLGATIDTFAIGDELTTDAAGRLVKLTDAASEKAVGTVVYVGEFRNGNMYEWAGTAANGGKFLGFVLHM